MSRIPSGPWALLAVVSFAGFGLPSSAAGAATSTRSASTPGDEYCTLVHEFHDVVVQPEYELRLAQRDTADDDEYVELQEVAYDYAVELAELAPIPDRHVWRWLAEALVGVAEGSEERLEAIRSSVRDECGFDVFAVVGPDGAAADAMVDPIDENQPIPADGQNAQPTAANPDDPLDALTCAGDSLKRVLAVSVASVVGRAVREHVRRIHVGRHKYWLRRHGPACNRVLLPYGSSDLR